MDYENMTAEERGIAQAEARFGYYREKTTEELQKELENLDIDLDDWEKVLSNATITEEANDARREIMLASSFSHNGLTNIARPMCFRVHQLEHVLSAYDDKIAHGAGLAVAWPAYAKYIYKNEKALPKFLRLAYEVFNVKETNNKEEDAYNGILKLEEFFKELGMPLKMKDLGIGKDALEHLALKVSFNKTRTIEDVIPLRYKEFKEIYELMY